MQNRWLLSSPVDSDYTANAFTRWHYVR